MKMQTDRTNIVHSIPAYRQEDLKLGQGSRLHRAGRSWVIVNWRLTTHLHLAV